MSTETWLEQLEQRHRDAVVKREHLDEKIETLERLIVLEGGSPMLFEVEPEDDESDESEAPTLPAGPPTLVGMGAVSQRQLSDAFRTTDLITPALRLQIEQAQKMLVSAPNLRSAMASIELLARGAQFNFEPHRYPNGRSVPSDVVVTIPPATLPERVVAVLEANDEAVAFAELLTVLRVDNPDTNEKSLRGTLSRMERDHKLRRPTRGVYALPHRADEAGGQGEFEELVDRQTTSEEDDLVST